MRFIISKCKSFFKKLLKRIMKSDDKFKKSKKSTWKDKYALYVSSEPVESKWVLYESHQGIGMVCNPLAIFKAFQRMSEFQDYTHIWVVADSEEYERLKIEYSEHKNILFIRYNSERYAYYIAKAKYLINNTSFNPCFHKRNEQIYLNTWHSVTVKTLGYDTPDAPRVIRNMLRNMLMSDYIISANEFMTKIFNDSFRLRDVYQGKYIVEGHPRNDLTLGTERSEILKKLQARGTKIDCSKKIILYAPTWSGNDARNPIIDTKQYLDFYEYLSNHIDTDKYQILIKPHHVVYRRLTLEELRSGIYISYTIDANELLSVTDILVTDYSSIYFDFLVSRKPILFYIPDYEKYSKTRGIYFKLDELPGPCCNTLQGIVEKINCIDDVSKEYRELYDKICEWACKYDDGMVSEKILDIIIRGNRDYNIKSASKTEKKRLLIYLGSLATNGVTSAGLSLLKNIDRSKYDISVFVHALKNDDQNVNFDKIPDDVRTILRVSAPMLTPEDRKVYSRMLTQGIPENVDELQHLQRIMRSEFVRIFGNACFDHLIDFSGYRTYVPVLFTLGYANTNAKFYMWQHNDMFMDYSNSKKMQLNNNKVTIAALKSCYNRADKIVSATKEICDINKRKLATLVTESKFTYCTNLMDQERISWMLQGENVIRHMDSIEFFTYSHEPRTMTSKVFPLRSKQLKFVTMGRCMPEKNQANIIRAIKRLYNDGHDVVLYIIGDGYLRSDLEKMVTNIGIENRVFFTGILQNPLALIRNCDCFVFPSLYEAQGLSVLEARVAGVPIIVSNYEAVKSVLYNDYQYVLEGFDSESIYQGMLAFIRGEIPSDYIFSVEEYNKRGFTEFDKLFN